MYKNYPMRSYTISALFLIILVLFLGSCSVNKRQYMPGYQINWKNGKTTTGRETALVPAVQKEKKEPFHEPTELTAGETIITASTGEQIILPKSKITSLTSVVPRSNKNTAFVSIKNSKDKFPIKKAGPSPEVPEVIIIALVFGLGGLLFSPLAVPAVFLALKGRRQIKAEPGKYGGEDLAIVALVLGIVGCVILLISLAFIAFFILLAASII
jgi:hypothetical protein